MNSKHDDVEAVLKRSEQLLDSIVRKYRGALEGKSIPSDLLVEIKDYLGNLKSALDYSAQKVGKSNFPIRETEKDFDSLSLKFSGDLKEVVKKWQPFNNNFWLSLFNALNNKSKHLTLIPQQRKETKEFTIKKGGGTIIMRDCKFSGSVRFQVGGVVVPIDESTQFPVDTPGVDIERKIWVDFVFDNSSIENFPPNVSVLPFLKECFEKIKLIISELELEYETK